MKKKLFSLILALLMIAPSLASCAEKSSNETEESSPAAETAVDTIAEAEEVIETEPELSDDLPDTNLEGYNFRILSIFWYTYEGAHRIMYEEYTGDPIFDRLRDSTLYIEDRFNCSMSYISGGNEHETKAKAETSIKAGDNSFDIMINHDLTSFDMAKDGLFYNMFDIEQFNFEKPWWQPTTDLVFCDQLLCASSYLSYIGLHWTRALTLNKDYMTNLNLEVPYDTVREGKWTLDELLKLVNGTAQDIDGNGKIEAGDNVGYVTGTQTYYCLQEALDLSPYKRDAEGNMTFDFNIERADLALQKLRTLTESSDYLMDGSGHGQETFKTGRAMIVYGDIGNAQAYFQDSDFHYAFLPTPKLDELQENYINCCTDLPWAIPKTISPEQADVIGTIVEATSCYNYKYVLPAYFDVTMKSRIADSPDDAEMLQLIADTRKISFAFSYSMHCSNFLTELLESNKELASYAKTYQKVATKDLEKLVKVFENMKDA